MKLLLLVLSLLLTKAYAENPLCNGKAYLISQYVDVIEKKEDISLLGTLLSKKNKMVPGIESFIIGYINYNYTPSIFKDKDNCISYWSLISDLNQLHRKRIKNLIDISPMRHSKILNASLFSNFENFFLERVQMISNYKKGSLIIIKNKSDDELIQFTRNSPNVSLYTKSISKLPNMYTYNTVFDIAANEFLNKRLDKKSVEKVIHNILSASVEDTLCPTTTMLSKNYQDSFLKESEAKIFNFLKVICPSLL